VEEQRRGGTSRRDVTPSLDASPRRLFSPPFFFLRGSMRLVLGLLLVGSFVSAQQVRVSPSAVAREDSIERALISSPDTQSARLWTKALSRVPHMSGTPQQAVTRDYVLNL